jgi:hypothetical protein
MKNPYLALATLVALLTIAALFGYAGHEKNLRLEAQAKVVSVTLERDGFAAAAAAAPKEVIKLVPTVVTKEITKLVHDKVVAPVASSTTSASTTINVPCPPATSGSAPSTAVALTFTHDLLITRIRFGDVQWKDSVAGTATVNGVTTRMDFPQGSVLTHVAVSKDILADLHAHELEGGWWKRHTKFMAPGVGVTYDPLDPARPVSVGIVVGYGFVWP